MAANFTSPEPKPFKIAVSDDLLSFIKQRVDTARLPPGLDLPKGEEWSFGIPPSTISHLQEYWKTKYDWRTVEARINGHLKMFTLPISEGGENLNIHFVHHQSTHSNAIPLLFQHGWPGSFLEVDKIIDLLTAPEPGQQAYHVVAPSLPGFTFSDYPKGGEFNIQNMAAVDHKLMLALGYDKYIVQGGDWGSMIARIMAVDFPESCLGVHINMLGTGPPTWWRYPFHLAYLVAWAMLQGKDSAFQRMLWWQKEESGYFEIQGTKPLTLGYGLVDSPIGTLAWLREKMEPLVDDDFTWEEEEVCVWGALFFLFENVSRGVPLDILFPFKPFSLKTSTLETYLGSNGSKSPPEEVIANSSLMDRR